MAIAELAKANAVANVFEDLMMLLLLYARNVVMAS
jgi:hypothetical protein